jgi:large subunit ribosomal protein L4
MATIQVRDASGQVLGERALPEEYFGAPVNVPLLHQVVVAGAAAQRAGTHATKTRGMVSGGGIKPWRQKGTGRARQGSIRAPHWTGGGVAHGPQPRSYDMRVNKKMKRAALRAALTDTLQSGKLALVQELTFEGPRTKDAVSILRALELAGRVLVVLAAPDQDAERSFRNLTNVRVCFPGNLSTFDLISADRVLFTADALDLLTGEQGERFASAAPPGRDGEGQAGEDDAGDAEGTRQDTGEDDVEDAGEGGVEGEDA